MPYQSNKRVSDYQFCILALFQVFHLYLYTVSLVFLIYLHCYLLHQKPSRKTPRGNIRLVSNNQLDSPDKSALAVQETSDISSGHSQKEGNRSRTPSDGEVESYHEAPRPVTYDSNGVNFYLRLGAIGKHNDHTVKCVIHV